MDAQPNLPLPPQLFERMRVFTNDLQRARANLASGRLQPEHYQAIERVLNARLELLEAEVHARVLDASRKGQRPAWSMSGAGGAG